MSKITSKAFFVHTNHLFNLINFSPSKLTTSRLHGLFSPAVAAEKFEQIGDFPLPFTTFTDAFTLAAKNSSWNCSKSSSVSSLPGLEHIFSSVHKNVFLPHFVRHVGYRGEFPKDWGQRQWNPKMQIELPL